MTRTQCNAGAAINQSIVSGCGSCYPSLDNMCRHIHAHTWGQACKTRLPCPVPFFHLRLAEFEGPEVYHGSNFLARWRTLPVRIECSRYRTRTGLRLLPVPHTHAHKRSGGCSALWSSFSIMSTPPPPVCVCQGSGSGSIFFFFFFFLFIIIIIIIITMLIQDIVYNPSYIFFEHLHQLVSRNGSHRSEHSLLQDRDGAWPICWLDFCCCAHAS